VARKPRALVTGGAGFVGSHLCDGLLSEGYRVLCADNLRTGTLENVAHLEAEPDLEYIDHDVTAHINVPGELDEVYHFASPRARKTLRASRSIPDVDARTLRGLERSLAGSRACLRARGSGGL